MNCINLPEFRVIKAEENEFDYQFTDTREIEMDQIMTKNESEVEHDG